MSLRRSKYELIVECKPEWSTSYIFINKKYQFNVYLCDKQKKTKRIKKPRTNCAENSNSNSLDSKTYTIRISCIDNESKTLHSNEHSILPSAQITNLSLRTYHSFTVTINKLSMNHGNSQFRLRFDCEDPALDSSIANSKFISVRVINYKFKILSTPSQLTNDDYKFYKDVKPKTNFLRYDIALFNAHNKRCKPPRKVAIKCTIYFQNGAESPNQKALNLKGINTIYNEPYTLNKSGMVTVPLRIEETSTKYENRKFLIKFIADYEKITSNLDIAPVFSRAFLVRTKINKYRIKNKELKKKPGRKKIKRQTPPSSSYSDSDSSHSSHSIDIATAPKKERKANVPPIPSTHIMPPLKLPPYIMPLPPLFATAPGIDGEMPTLPLLTLPALTVDNKKQKMSNKRNVQQAGLGIAHQSNKRRKLSKCNRPTTRSMTRQHHHTAVSAVESVKYAFNEDTCDKILQPIVIEAARMLSEAMSRREYFVSGTECHCYLKCLFCGCTAYPPKETHIKHTKSCMLSVIYENITTCVDPEILRHAFDADKNLNNNHNNLLNMPQNIPPIPSLNEMNNMNNNIPSKRQRRNSAGSASFSLCNSFNGFMAPYNSLLLGKNSGNVRSRSGSFNFAPNPTQTPIPPLFPTCDTASFNGSMSGTQMRYASFPADATEVYARSQSAALLPGFPVNLLSGSNLSLSNHLKNMDNASNSATNSDQSSVKTQQI